MLAVVMHEFGAPEVLRVEQIPLREPGAGEVLLKVKAVSVGRLLDVDARAGHLPWARIALPHVLGAEHAGVIEQVGDGVAGFGVGDRVAVFPAVPDDTCRLCREGHEEACQQLELIGIQRPGAYATYSTVPAKQLHRLPDGIDDVEACALSLNGPVARNQIESTGIRRGSWVLVQSAASALGSCVAMLAAFHGARVIGTSRHPEKQQALLDMGVEAALDWQATDFIDRLRDLTDGRGVDVAIDNIGDARMFGTTLQALAARGTLVTSGAFAGGLVSLDLREFYVKSQRIIGVRTGNRRSVEALWSDVGRGFRALVDRTFPLTEAVAAHRYLDRQESVGRVVLVPDE